MRPRFLLALVTLVVCAALSLSSARLQQPPQSSAPTQNPAPQVSQPAPARPPVSVVVLDPGHGGTDTGARGSSGIVESDIVLLFARQIKDQLERQGLRVLLTRQGNENSSFDDRAALVNGQRGALFITLHVSTTGKPGTARAYSYAPPNSTPAEHSTLISWDEAQTAFAAASRQFAELTQVQLWQRFHGSPDAPLYAQVRQLRTVAAPAIAVEISSVSVESRVVLDQMAAPLAEAIARAVVAYRASSDPGARP